METGSRFISSVTDSSLHRTETRYRKGQLNMFSIDAIFIVITQIVNNIFKKVAWHKLSGLLKLSRFISTRC